MMATMMPRPTTTSAAATTSTKNTTTCPPTSFNAVEKATKALGYSHMDAVSGAGHDAVYMAKVAPSAMIFVPCVGGISHNEIEDATPAWIEAGCNVLLHAILGRAGR